MTTFNVGDLVEILMQGKWEGPYTVYRIDGARTEDHIVLRNAEVLFEHYNDAPYNTRKVN